MSRHITSALLAVMLLSLGLKLITDSVSAQGTALKGVATVRLADGLVVEEVKVGGSCVVIVSRGGPGASAEGLVYSGNMAAVPCKP